MGGFLFFILRFHSNGFDCTSFERVLFILFFYFFILLCVCTIPVRCFPCTIGTWDVFVSISQFVTDLSIFHSKNFPKVFVPFTIQPLGAAGRFDRKAAPRNLMDKEFGGGGDPSIFSFHLSYVLTNPISRCLDQILFAPEIWVRCFASCPSSSPPLSLPARLPRHGNLGNPYPVIPSKDDANEYVRQAIPQILQHCLPRPILSLSCPPSL